MPSQIRHAQPAPAPWRTMRRNAIDKKGALDVELLQEMETIVMSKRPDEVPRPVLRTAVIKEREKIKGRKKNVGGVGARWGRWGLRQKISEGGRPIGWMKKIPTLIAAASKRLGGEQRGEQRDWQWMRAGGRSVAAAASASMGGGAQIAKNAAAAACASMGGGARSAKNAAAAASASMGGGATCAKLYTI